MSEESDTGTERSPLLQDNRNGATFSHCREYRYRLWRSWDASKPTLAFVMLNPSTADETANDPTIRRCLGYAEDWGYGTLIVGNIFALRSTDPDNLYGHEDPVGPRNDDELKRVCEDAEQVIAAWGTHGALEDRGASVGELLEGELYALDTTKDGHPVHPLYQPKDIEPEPWSPDELDYHD